jgi:undecaprenyl diphosphate synthase
VIGRRDRLPSGLAEGIERAEAATASGAALHLRIALDYSSRDAIAQAARLEVSSPDGLARALSGPDGVDDVDLLLRTGGEKRLSDFLLWECAYAELVFSDRLWPDVTAADVADALADFGSRQRRFGGIPAAA